MQRATADPPPFEIRRADVIDVPAMHDLIVAAVEPHRDMDFDGQGWQNFLAPNTHAAIEKRIRDPRYLILCADLDDGLIGLLTMMDHFRLQQLFVLPTARKRGVATALWREAKSLCEAQGNQGHYVVKSSSLAVPVYRSFGFRLMGERQEAEGIAFYPMVLGDQPAGRNNSQ